MRNIIYHVSQDVEIARRIDCYLIILDDSFMHSITSSATQESKAEMELGEVNLHLL
jgi:hypothetical protein